MLSFTLAVCLFYRIMYRELKDSDKEKESGKMVIYVFTFCPPPLLSQQHLFISFARSLQLIKTACDFFPVAVSKLSQSSLTL